MEFDPKSELRSFGATDDNIRLLNEPKHYLIDYLDLIPNNRTNTSDPTQVWLDAVVETQNQPLLYAIRSAALGQDPTVRNEQVKKLRRDLACRGHRLIFCAD